MPDQDQPQDNIPDRTPAPRPDPNDVLYAWVRRACAVTPAASPTAIAATVAAVRNAVDQNRPIPFRAAGATPRGDDIPVRRLGIPWIPWMPMAATGLATAGVVLLLVNRPHVAGRAPVVPTHATRLDTIGAPPVRGAVAEGAPRQPRLPLAPDSAPHIAPRVPSITSASVGAPASQDSVATVPSSRPLPTPPLSPQAPSQFAAREHAVDGLDPESAALASHILDSAAAQGLPTEALTARIREGVHRGIPGPRIVVVARNFATALANARSALGAPSSAADMQAGAEALLTGVPAAALQQLRTARPTGSITEPLVTLADLATHGVAPLQASQALAALMTQPGSDTLVRALRTSVVSDIIHGVPPAAALADRVDQQHIGTLQHPRPLLHPSDSMPLQRGIP